jgi:myosin heavy subunit
MVPATLRAADLDRVAAQLTDQRVELVEQWERLARVEQSWQERRDEAINALEMLAERLARDESDLARRTSDLQSCERQLQKRQEQLDQLRRDATAAQLRAEVQQQAWESEREHILAEASHVHEVARYQFDLMGELRRKWNRRRRQETEALRAERRNAERVRQELAEARQELLRQAQKVDDERRELLERAMALHERRQESHAPAGDARSQAEQLRRRWLTQNAAVVRALKLQRAGLKKELDRLSHSQAELAEQADRLAQAQTVSREQEISLEQREAALAATQAHLDQQQKRNEGRAKNAELRLALLQDETEHLARALIPDSDESLPLERAA